MNEMQIAERIFEPRRLGHANIYVSDYERLFDFYNQVVGFEEVYRQPDNRASFISNGNTYHDMALTDIASKYAGPNRKPGLFHIAFELENEVALVRDYRRAVAAGVRFSSTEDHDVAHSLYTTDPDGNGVEMYADVVADWRAARNGTFARKKPKWVPGETTVPIAEPMYPVAPEIRKVPGAVFNPRKVGHVCFATYDFESMFDYYAQVVGLSVFSGSRTSAYAVFSGSSGDQALSLIRAPAGTKAGLHHVGIEVMDIASLQASIAIARHAGVDLVQVVDHPARLSAFIRDPDGALLQLYVDKEWNRDNLGELSAVEAMGVL